MKEERMKILDMVEKGIINADEARLLLGSLSTKSDDDKLKEFANNVADFAKDVGEKTKEACAAASPKIKKATKVVVTKTACLVENISKSLNEAVKKMECEAHPDEECDCDCDEKDSE